jgi:FtsP/CotA-like multicopper oxidase with cupredoxin domain
MFNPGHEAGRVSRQEIFAATLNGLVYREYRDAAYQIPNTAKLVLADANEPPWDRRVPGTVLYTRPGERLYIHVLNGDADECHSLHLHGLRYGIDSDGAWPFGITSRDGRRSDEIRPGERWTYIFDATPDTIGAWAFHDHAHGVQRNINRGLFGGLIVRDPAAPCADHEIPLFVHQLMGGTSEYAFQSKSLGPGDTFSFTFGTTLDTCHYICAIHGASMAGEVQVVPGGRPARAVTIRDNLFDPASVTIGPGGTVTWTNQGSNRHIVFAAGGGAATFCLNGRQYVGNTPTILAESGERLRWYLFNLDIAETWHNFHPHSARWQLPSPPGGAVDVHALSPVETFVTDTEVPEALRLPCALADLQCDPPVDACRVALAGDFLFHCHVEAHMMAGLAGLVRARQYVWITEEVLRGLPFALPYDDGSNACPLVDMTRCQPEPPQPPRHEAPPHGRPSISAHQPGPAMPSMPPMESAMPMDMGMSMPMPLDLRAAATQGLWELLPCDSQVLAVHAALLHTGKVLFFSGSGNDPDKQPAHDFRSVVWDYENGAFYRPPTPIDFFCAGQAFLPDGRLLVAGGTRRYDNFQGLRDAYLFDPTLEEWIHVQDMADGRWYPTLVTLGDGRILAVSGRRETFDANGNPQPNLVSEIYANASGWTALPAVQQAWPLYPHLFLLHDGTVFFSGGNMDGNAGLAPFTLQVATSTPAAAVGGLTVANKRDQAASVLLPPAQDQRVMIMGGGNPATSAVAIADLAAANPTYSPADPLNFARMHLNAVLLPDRTVFVSGGAGHAENVPSAVLESEIYDPDTGHWTVAATATVPRLYHSVALLLPDGRVITAGSNPTRKNDELRLELYHPPYLFRGPQPFIQDAPQMVTYGGPILIESPQAADIQWVHLIRPMATTHSCDAEQRLVDIPFRHHGLCRLVAQMPDEPNLAPPGWYMLFIADHRGVPSVARWVHVSGPEAPTKAAQRRITHRQQRH